MSMKLGTETGSLINHVLSGVVGKSPKVGDGATIFAWSDRYAGTIVEVGPTYFIIQEDSSVRIDNNGMSESQEYEYFPNPEGRKFTFKQVRSGKKKGQWRVDGLKDGLCAGVGYREKYYDFSF